MNKSSKWGGIGGMIVVFGLCVITASACSDEQAVSEKKAVPDKPIAKAFVCDSAMALALLTKAYPRDKVSMVTTNSGSIDQPFSRVSVTKALKSADGQITGKELHVFDYRLADTTPNQGRVDACFFDEVFTAREVGNSRVERDFKYQWIRFYQNGQLIYTDTSLRASNNWLRVYEDIQFVPTEIPNWAVRDGLDLYMTWIARSAATASRVPVWGTEIIWQRDGDDFTLIAGKVFLKNPKEKPTAEEIVTVMRFNAEGVVDSRGILFPVAETTWNEYLSYLRNQKNEWRRDREADELASKTFFDGPIKESRLRELAQADVFKRRGVMVSNLPEKPGSNWNPPVDSVLPGSFIIRSVD